MKKTGGLGMTQVLSVRQEMLCTIPNSGGKPDWVKHTHERKALVWNIYINDNY